MLRGVNRSRKADHKSQECRGHLPYDFQIVGCSIPDGHFNQVMVCAHRRPMSRSCLVRLRSLGLVHACYTAFGAQTRNIPQAPDRLVKRKPENLRKISRKQRPRRVDLEKLCENDTSFAQIGHPGEKLCPHGPFATPRATPRPHTPVTACHEPNRGTSPPRWPNTPDEATLDDALSARMGHV